MDVTPEKTYAVVATLIFAGFVAITLLGALVAASTQRLVRSVSGLALSFVGLAGLYYYLHNPFLALMQVLIYVGAVCVMILFALMMADALDQPSQAARARNFLAGAASLLMAGMVAIALTLLIGKTSWMAKATPINTGSVSDLGFALLGRFGFAFELISVVLLLAILGALVVARTGRGTHRE